MARTLDNLDFYATINVGSGYTLWVTDATKQSAKLIITFFVETGSPDDEVIDGQQPSRSQRSAPAQADVGSAKAQDAFREHLLSIFRDHSRIPARQQKAAEEAIKAALSTMLMRILDRLRDHDTGNGKASTTDQVLAALRERRIDYVYYEGVPYATYATAQRVETQPLHSATFKDHVINVYREQTSKALSQRDLTDVLTNLTDAAKATQKPVCIRVGRVGDTCYLDLADQDGHVVEITAEAVVTTTLTLDAPLLFLRPEGMQPLPIPAEEGSLDGLNVLLHDIAPLSASEVQLIRHWLVASLWLPPVPTPPSFTALTLDSSCGGNSHDLGTLLAALVDPHTKRPSHHPRHPNDVFLRLRSSWLGCLEPTFHLDDYLAKNLYQTLRGTGRGDPDRYTTIRDPLFYGAHPLLLTGTADSGYPPLRNHSITVSVPYLPSTQRRDDTLHSADVQKYHPQILRGLLDAIQYGLKHESAVDLANIPPAATFARHSRACAEALGWRATDFDRAYHSALVRQSADPLDTPPSLIAVRDLLSRLRVEYYRGMPDLESSRSYQIPTRWEKQAADLDIELEQAQRQKNTPLPPGWHKNAAELSKLLGANPDLLADLKVAFRRKKPQGHDRLRGVLLVYHPQNFAYVLEYLQGRTDLEDPAPPKKSRANGAVTEGEAHATEENRANTDEGGEENEGRWLK